MDRNQRFMYRMFRKYYRDNSPILPDRFARREFGFLYFGKDFMNRHIGFSTEKELQKFVEMQVPAHGYYSTAYYRKPAAPTMEEKEWMGAELIFDLDADHLAGAESMSYDEMMGQIKKEMKILLDSFLYDDLGFSEEDVHIVFSGGRGYHAHVRVPEVLSLGTHERREIVDYIRGKGLNIDSIFPTFNDGISTTTVNGVAVNNVKIGRKIPPADSSGWSLRLRNGLIDVIEDFSTCDVKQLYRMYPSLKGKKLEKMQEDIIKKKNVVLQSHKMTEFGKRAQDILITILKDDVVPKLSGEVDEPVTPDIKRLIRLPGTVHGKTGLIVTPLSRNELNDFDPLNQAVPKEYGEDEVLISMKKDFTLDMCEQHFNLTTGVQKVPSYAAVFLIGRKLADFGDGSKQDNFF